MTNRLFIIGAVIVGALYVLVPAADLAEGRVDRAMGVLQC